MRLQRKELLEDCFDGSGIFLYYFDEPIAKTFIMTLSRFGKLEYFSEFPRPFFRVVSLDGLQMKGVEGEYSIRVLLPSQNRQVLEESVLHFFCS
ncbi:MAG: hypothetical protein OEM52_09825 [bacterium]|nr:hypothetical protein [bacterium]